MKKIKGYTMLSVITSNASVAVLYISLALAQRCFQALHIYFCLAQVSFNPTVRLKIGCSGVEFLSAVKYPVRWNCK